MREDVIGRANVEDTPELDRYYDRLGSQDSYALWTVANSIEPWQPKPPSLPVLWSYDGDAPAGAAGARSGQPREGRPARHRAGESRPQGPLGLRRLALHRPAGDAAGRVRHRAQSCLGGAALHHRGRRAPTRWSTATRCRSSAGDFVITPNGTWHDHGVEAGGADDGLAGRPRHAAGQPARRQLLRRASRARAEVELSGQRHGDGLRRAGPAADGRRSLEQAVLAAAQVRMGADLRGAGARREGERRLALRRHHHAIRQSGDRRPGDEDARRLHPVAARRRTHQGASPHRLDRLQRRQGHRAIRSSTASASTGRRTTSSWCRRGPGTSTPTRRSATMRCCSRSAICRRCRRSASIAKRRSPRTADTSALAH